MFSGTFRGILSRMSWPPWAQHRGIGDLIQLLPMAPSFGECAEAPEVNSGAPLDNESNRLALAVRAKHYCHLARRTTRFLFATC